MHDSIRNKEDMNNQEIRLMDLSHGAGCGCKIGPGELGSILSRFKSKSTDPRVLVGIETGDDAGVIQLTEEIAIIQTTDFFTPIMNDPYRFGQVAAANAISDIYAMGGTPLSALALVAFPLEKLGKEILGQILKGGIDKAAEAGIEIIGGHTIDDAEPKYGLAVVGTINPQKIIRNRGAKEGDFLVLTKPLGVGVLTTAIKRGILSKDLEDLAFRSMASLNNCARDAMLECFQFIHSATDVTGFGLAGHLSGMLRDSGLKARIEMENLPVLPGVFELLEKHCYPGGTARNWKYLEKSLVFSGMSEELHEKFRLLICDPQTSGGLLVALDPAGIESFLFSLNSKNTIASVIGNIVKSDDHCLIELSKE